mmetsp:Transcript_2397/g.5727  ORF Transcript_2397/g.5727 Transcript_2397/m.5727 type:complete len:611 (-) Transcript_2397:452-2284(-)|eukprot:CAMPEP_0206264866 /NCGR_PEP_ID=MMETSP0047_2-20121206/29658_1 /ASSEMBLY_ACC=CAM_ASM_000192 /TAXON_ID=195065 /ORGANISM="Chroomonas mesostigmatica_cf, Strain CCMP1168" /LENGTH=610 /DNA_ID=CAMNT_0053692659 /DNA_START=38 /DNA_END=1870 /DNA_ORIENTATION=+
MKPGAYVAVAGLAVAVPFLARSPTKLAALAAAALASYAVLRPPRPVVDEEELPPQRRGITADRYADSKVPEDLDVIVIGSGMSGLSCAAVLARTGKRVLVLEQHDRAGGGTHTYELGPKNWSFDAGLHYAIPECGLLLQLCTGSEEIPVPFELMGETPHPDGSVTYDKLYLGDEPVFELKLWQKHLPDLRKRFPDLQKDIDKYCKEATEAVDCIPTYVFSKLLPFSWQKAIRPYLLRNFVKHTKTSVKDALDKITQDKRLRSLFACMWIDTGIDPFKCPFWLLAAIFWGFPQRGGAYPRGGSQRMSGCLIPVIERMGGRVLVRADVKNVEVEGGRAVGVRLQTGRVIKAPLVISSAGYTNTFGKLVPEKDTLAANIPRSLSIPASSGLVMVCLGLNGTKEELGLTNVNSWYIPVDKEGCHFGALEAHWKDPTHPDYLPMMISFPSMKDHDEWGAKNHSCQVLMMAEHAYFKKWAGGKSGDRGEFQAEYDALKKKFLDATMKRVYQFYPKLQGRVEFSDVSTPLSIEYYLRDPEGGACGLDHGAKRFLDMEIQERLDMKTPIKGLWMTGHDTLFVGVPLVQLAGIITALRISGFFQSARFLISNLFFTFGK